MVASQLVQQRACVKKLKLEYSHNVNVLYFDFKVICQTIWMLTNANATHAQTFDRSAITQWKKLVRSPSNGGSVIKDLLSVPSYFSSDRNGSFEEHLFYIYEDYGRYLSFISL